jgi:hypothetical protein
MGLLREDSILQMNQKMRCGKFNALWKECESEYANNGEDNSKGKSRIRKKRLHESMGAVTEEKRNPSTERE